MYNEISDCLCCGGSNLYKVLDLNDQPLANSYLNDETGSELTFPLAVNFCNDCTHIQLTHAVNPDLLFKNYLYVSGTTKTLREYFDWFVDFVESRVLGKTVLDIACNDGTQLDSFKHRGYNTYGIDPAENLYGLSSKNHGVVCDYFNKDNLDKFDTKFDVIVAQNVFAHNTYPKQFLEDCKEILNDDGCIFIQTSQADMVLNNQFDTIYHEHISFFSVESFCALAKRVGLNVIEVARTDIHGTSFVFVLSNSRTDKSIEYIQQEVRLTPEIMENYADTCRRITKEATDKIQELRSEGYRIVGYGAAAKGNTFLNFSKMYLDYIVDDNQLKQGLYSPGSKIKILSPDALLNEEGLVCVVPLAWNFFNEIKQKVLDRKKDNIVFLKYFPEVVINDA